MHIYMMHWIHTKINGHTAFEERCQSTKTEAMKPGRKGRRKAPYITPDAFGHSRRPDSSTDRLVTRVDEILNMAPECRCNGTAKITDQMMKRIWISSVYPREDEMQTLTVLRYRPLRCSFKLSGKRPERATLHQ